MGAVMGKKQSLLPVSLRMVISLVGSTAIAVVPYP